MTTKPLRRNFILSAILLCTGALAAQQDGPVTLADADLRYEFVNQELRDIVYILSLRSGLPLICDDTVTGTGSFLFRPSYLSDAGGGV